MSTTTTTRRPCPTSPPAAIGAQPMTTTERPTEADNLRQMLRFHMDRAERHRLRAEKAEAELAELKKESHP